MTHEKHSVWLCRDCVEEVVGGKPDQWGYCLPPLRGVGCWRCGVTRVPLAPFTLPLETTDGQTYRYWNHYRQEHVLLHAALGGTQAQLDELEDDDDE